MLTETEIAAFVTDGFVRVDQVFSGEIAEAGREILWRATGYDPDDRSTWVEPVVRLGDFPQEPFRVAVNARALHEAFDQLIGPEQWVPRNSLGGWPIRFPSLTPSGDDGWHVDASFGDDPNDYMTWRLNLRTRGRALLMLFLFSDVDFDDAPTRIRVGSHLRLPPVLAPHGERGLRMREMLDVYAATDDLPQALATGQAGDVYLCHPFLVHAAQPNLTGRPKFMAQPPLVLREPCVLDRPDGRYTPLERAIRLGLEGSAR
ncbi:phytanoyl-CoA dioxygenase family protein [Nocardia macrotermitis]|uniref:Phytanoyl-CoA dioxygenase n=1 Tax=Nocardia macrotermitis TaxID=2585198 RepID=A0A7K0CX74_9NOCA|nr:phytanoyl-CoA dioxygenase family protein [Nocardia macrotermitis]MQY18023.1 hypothetical protein [Nocardia macrotermitis]